MNILYVILLLVSCIFFYYLTVKNSESHKDIIAIAHLNEINGIKGDVMFYQMIGHSDNVLIDINLNGLPSNMQLGFHIHEAGDLSESCKSACAHFNPYKQLHGGPKSDYRHVGDLGNIVTDSYGNCKMKFTDNMIKLNGENNIIGRSIVIHEKTDDLGMGGNSESLKTGNAGSRICCAVIGYSKKMFV